MQIDHEYIDKILEEARKASDEFISAALDKSDAMEGLTHKEVAALLATEKPEFVNRIFETAGKIKESIYGNRIVMFAPLYVSDYCVNRCAYCSFNNGRDFDRRILGMDELRSEVMMLERMGHKRLALEAGEDPGRCTIDYILDCIKTIYEMKFENGEIRRVNVNIAATTVENYRRLNEAGIGTYILFQETYHRDAYLRVHTAGPKRNYEYHLNAFDRAMQGGVEDVGGGVLFGLHDPYFEVMGLMLHNEHLEKEYGVGFHTISVPRLCKAPGITLESFPDLVDDDTFEKIVAVIRLAVPFTGMILSTRETRDMRQRLLKAGISQLSAGSSTEVGGYVKREESCPQFEVKDERSALSVIEELIDTGYIPSFCTACYRSGRTGDRFMRLAKSGQIGNVCLPNALLTLQEYARDYGDESLRAKADDIAARCVKDIQNEKVRERVIENIESIKHGTRDLYL